MCKKKLQTIFGDDFTYQAELKKALGLMNTVEEAENLKIKDKLLRKFIKNVKFIIEKCSPRLSK